ncbi:MULTISPECIES: NAD(P)H-dependent oxidoreductase [Robinsoniella]|uniref:NAD(P)H-dependent oxidoreductase n=1 Tax=Robinsoniella TaxID=588605 RepID=UPI0012DE4547
MKVLLTNGSHGFIFGTPVHCGAAPGGMTSFLDRVFYTDHAHFWKKHGIFHVSCAVYLSNSII